MTWVGVTVGFPSVAQLFFLFLVTNCVSPHSIVCSQNQRITHSSVGGITPLDSCDANQGNTCFSCTAEWLVITPVCMPQCGATQGALQAVSPQSLKHAGGQWGLAQHPSSWMIAKWLTGGSVWPRWGANAEGPWEFGDSRYTPSCRAYRKLHTVHTESTTCIGCKFSCTAHGFWRMTDLKYWP